MKIERKIAATSGRSDHSLCSVFLNWFLLLFPPSANLTNSCSLEPGKNTKYPFNYFDTQIAEKHTENNNNNTNMIMAYYQIIDGYLWSDSVWISTGFPMLFKQSTVKVVIFTFSFLMVFPFLPHPHPLKLRIFVNP